MKPTFHFSLFTFHEIMDSNNWSVVQFATFIVVVVLLVKPVGAYLTRVFEAQPTFLDFICNPLERFIYKITRVDANCEMTWREYATSFVTFSLVGALILFLHLLIQSLLPFYNLTAEFLTTPMTLDLALNTAVSFVTTTTWQSYGGETTMSYSSQIVGLTVQNFLAGAGGLAVGIAFIRGLTRTETDKLGSFWVDLVRGTFRVLLPLSIIGSLFLIWQGVPVNFSAYTQISTLGGATQTVAQGPVAVLEFIKNLGTNGGGFFNVNGAHPFENPTPLTNFVEMLAVVILPAGLTNVFGRMIGNQRQGWTIFWTMTILFVAGLFFCETAEKHANPLLENGTTIEKTGNLEGKETRFGVGGSVLTAVVTSNGATGSYNSMHDSFTPLGSGVLLFNMLLGEIIYGGLGTGFYSFLMTALVGLFIAGLMVGRTPEYLGKKIGTGEIKLIMIYTLVAPCVILILTAIAVTTEAGLAGLTTNDGVHGFTSILFAYTSAFANNGQNFAGLSANNPFYNLTLTLAMLAGRFALAIPALALAGAFAKQRRYATTRGTLPTDGFLFGILVIGTALIVGGLSFFPTLALGSILEHLTMVK